MSALPHLAASGFVRMSPTLRADLRAAEEANGRIRYLRPEYQKGKDSGSRSQETQSPLNLKPSTTDKQSSPASKRKPAWPKSLADRVRLIDTLLQTTPGPHTAQSFAKQFTRASGKDDKEILETLTALGRRTAVVESPTAAG